MTEIQAALGLVQVEKLEQFTEQRIANAAFLTRSLSEVVQTPIARPGCRHVYHQYTIRVPGKRDEWSHQLLGRGIGTGIHYPTPIYRQPFYQEHSDRWRCAVSHDVASPVTSNRGLPLTEAAAQQVLSLPVHPALTKEDLVTIAKEVLRLCD
jgi:perosamine synthetase